MQQFPHRITLQKKISKKNDFSENVASWVDVQTNIYASVKNITGSETNDSDQTKNFVSISVRIRNRPDVTTDLRALHRDRVLKIAAVLPSPDFAYIDLKCESWTDA